MNTPPRPAANAPLKGVSVLVTRAPRDAGYLTERLQTLGASVVHLPAIAIEPPEETGPLDDALWRLDTYDWIAFTSRNAVIAVFGRLEALRLKSGMEMVSEGRARRDRQAGVRPPAPTRPTEANAIHLPRVAAVGPSTAEELRSRGVGVALAPEAATASDLAAAMIALGIEGRRVLIPAGDIARPELPDALRSAGALVDVVTAYRTVQPLAARHAALEALRTGGVDVALLASPSAIRNLAAMLGAQAPVLQYVRIVCIGPTTAAAVRELGLEPACVAREHTIEGLVTALVEMYDTEKEP